MTCENVIRGFENVPYSWWSGSSQHCCKCRKPDETITDTWVTGWKLIWATLSPSTCPVSRMEDLAVVNTPKGLVQASPHWLQRLGVSYHILYWRSSTRTSFSCFDLSFSKLGFIYNNKRYQANKQWRRRRKRKKYGQLRIHESRMDQNEMHRKHAFREICKAPWVSKAKLFFEKSVNYPNQFIYPQTEIWIHLETFWRKSNSLNWSKILTKNCVSLHAN